MNNVTYVVDDTGARVEPKLRPWFSRLQEFRKTLSPSQDGELIALLSIQSKLGLIIEVGEVKK